MSERRKFIRIRESNIINYRVSPHYKSNRKLTQDLSLGGIRFIADHFIPLHSILKVEIKLGRVHKVINALVKIAWVKSIYNDEHYEVGAKFININHDDLNFLNDYLAHLEKNP